MSISTLRGLFTGRPLEDAVLGAFLAAFIFELILARRARREEVRDKASDRRPHAAILFLPLLVAINALDVKGYFLIGHGFGRYAISALFLATCVVTRRAKAGVSGIGVAAATCFVVYLLTGAILGTVYAKPQSSGLPIAASAVYLLVPIFAGKMSRRQCEWLSTGLLITCLLELAMNFLATAGYINSGVNRSVGPTYLYSNGTFTHEKVAIAFMAFHLVRRRTGAFMQISTVATMLVIFANYPAGTYVFAAIAYGLTMLMLRVRQRVALPIVLGIGATAFLAVTIVTGGGGSLEQKYYTAVGKTDNTSTRTILWDAALRAINERPWVGSKFAGEASVTVQSGNLPPLVPPHNDYLELALLGGWVALALFGAVVYLYLRELDGGTLKAVQAGRKVLAETLIVGIVVFLVSMTFNPSLLKVSLSSLFFCLLGVAACVGVPVEQDRAVESGAKSRSAIE